MKFDQASAVEQICSQMRLADYPRALNRALINELFNGFPPYEDNETDGTNVNFLEAPKIAHDARRQFSTAFCSPDPLFTVEIDYGPLWKRKEWSNRIQKEMNKIIKESLPYLELRGSTFASLVLHGIGPVMWHDQERWCPDDLGVEDVFVPSNTFRSLKNLPFFCILRQYTVPQILKMTRGRNVDPGWNMPLVKQCIKWADHESQTLMGSNWSDVWSPEKQVERMKGDGGWYAADAVPTIDCFDFYFYDDSKGMSGWKRRMILDAWGDPGAGGMSASLADSVLTRKIEHGKGDFLYNSGDRIYADSIEKIVHFNFADCSSVAPFRYHSIRSLGFLLYSVCHLQNRLRGKFNDAVFESLLQYFRVANPADMDRLMKINLIDKGVLEEGVQFVRPEERWQINDAIVQQAMGLNRQTMADNSASFTQDFDFSKEKEQETATRTMAKVNATTALVGAMLSQAYNYQTFQYREIARRFCIQGSKDLDVMKFRVRCLKSGVPEEALNIDSWNIQPVRVMGAGNQMMASAIADKLMAIAPRLDPTAQKEVDRMYIAANTNDYDLADRLVPEQPVVTDTIHDTEIVFGAIMQGSRITPKPGLNPQEVIETMLQQIGFTIQRIMQSGGVGTPQDVQGLYGAAQYTDSFIKMLSQDRNEKARVAAYGKELGKLMNEVKAFAQRQQQAAQAQQQQGGGMDPEAQSKIQATIITAKTKAQLAAQSHAQRTAQKEIAFETKMRQDEQKHKLKVESDMREHAANLAKTSMDAMQSARVNRLKSFEGE